MLPGPGASFSALVSVLYLISVYDTVTIMPHDEINKPLWLNRSAPKRTFVGRTNSMNESELLPYYQSPERTAPKKKKTFFEISSRSTYQRLDSANIDRISRNVFRCSVATVILTILIVIIYLVYVNSILFNDPDKCEIFCSGPILDAVQQSRLFDDSKHFVDMPMLADPAHIKDVFKSIPSGKSDELRRFVYTYFGDPSSVLQPAKPSDFPHNPLNINVKDKALSDWAQNLHDLWRLLVRKVHPEVMNHPERSSLILPKHNIFIIPGGRFREVYYWDSYWI
eukprot:275842_1